MKSLRQIVDAYDALKRDEERGVLATVVSARGDLGRYLGWRMLLRSKGIIAGDLGNTDLTTAVAQRAGKLLQTPEAITASFEINAPKTSPRSVADVLLEPLPLGGRSLHMKFLGECLLTGDGVIASIFRVEGEVRVSIGSHVFLSSSGTIEEDVRNPVLAAAITKDCIEVFRSRKTAVKEYRFTEGIIESLIEHVTASQQRS